MTEKNQTQTEQETAPTVQPGTDVSQVGQALVAQDDKTLQAMMDHAEKYLTFHDRIRKLALKLTSAADWIDENGKPYCQWSGTAKIARAFGVNYEQPNLKEEVIKQDDGTEVYQASYSGLIESGGRTIPEVGTATSRDSLFGRRTRDDGKGGRETYFLPLSEVSRTDVKKKAMTNWLNRGIKSQLGLSFTWEEIAQITEGRVTQEVVGKRGGGIRYDKGGKGGTVTGSPEVEEKRSKIRLMLLEMCGGKEDAAKIALEGYTTFTGRGNKKIPGKKNVKQLSAKAVEVTYDKVLKEFTAMMAQNNAGEESQTGEKGGNNAAS